MEKALQAIAAVAKIDLNKASKITRRQPLTGDEINIEEELINLEEAINSYHIASSTLKNYPAMRYHAKKERREVLTHCLGLVRRMLKGQQLPRMYTPKDVEYAVHKLTSLVVYDSHKLGYSIDKMLLKRMLPFMTVKQRWIHRDVAETSPIKHLKVAWQKLL